MKQAIYIGIDPDVEASGLGLVSTASQPVATHYATYALPELIAKLKSLTETAEAEVYIFIEAGWLNRGNWHLNPRDSKQLAAAKGRQAGRNHQLGLDICALLDHERIPHTEVAPLVKCWRGKDRKITHEELDTIIRWVNGKGMERNRSNQEERDALLLAWERSGLPIKC